MGDREWDPDDVLVVISHPFGRVVWPLSEWVAKGPGPRHGTHPESARSRATGQELPLTVIPLAYRNNRESRALIAAGRIESPWLGIPWRVADWGERPCEIGGPRVFNRSVPRPKQVDALASWVLGVMPSGPVDEQAARRVLARAPKFRDAAPLVIRRLVAVARWEQFDAIVRLAGAAGLTAVVPVLCEVLESDARPPRPGTIVEVLGQLGDGGSADLLERMFSRFVYAEADMDGARRCLRALSAIGGGQALARLHTISFADWPEPIPQWIADTLSDMGF